MQKASNSRFHWIDNCKALMLLLVMASHTSIWMTGTKGLAQVIACLPVMQVFFFLCGILHRIRQSEKTFLQFVRHRARLLLIPYVCFSIYNSVCKFCVLIFQHNLSRDIFVSEMRELLITGNGVVWFLLTLFVSESIFYGLFRLRKISLMIVLAMLSASIPFILDIELGGWEVVINRIFEAFPIIVAGYLLGAIFVKGSIPSRPTCMLIGISITLLAYVIGSGRLDYSFFSGTFSNPVVYILNTFLGSAGIVMIVLCVDKIIPIISSVGKNSLLVMLTHPTFVLIYAYGIVKKIEVGSFYEEWTIFILAYAAIIFLSMIASQIINKYLPFIIGRKKESYE